MSEKNEAGRPLIFSCAQGAVELSCGDQKETFALDLHGARKAVSWALCIDEWVVVARSYGMDDCESHGIDDSSLGLWESMFWFEMLKLDPARTRLALKS